MGTVQLWTLILFCGLTIGLCENVEVTLPGGASLRGTTEKSFLKERDYFAFRAIPYAQPPVDANRFMPTLPGYEWEGVFDATQEGEPCAQAAMGIMTGVEDCLNLYVYTPKLSKAAESSKPLPVVVWLHGGTFVVGSAGGLDESLLMDRDIVLVIPQYRLGFLGFFRTPGGSSGGNMGMLDQVAALKWIQQNIAAFGGDPQQVILAGEDAGGASGIYHMLSPLSGGLFHGVISLSGAPLAPWALMRQEHRFNLMVANFIKCPAYDSKIMVQCFQEVELFSELLNGTQMLMEGRDPVVGNNKIAPCVQEAVHIHESTLFLSDHPLKLLTEGKINKVPVIMGVTRDVGGYLVDMLFYEFVLFKMEMEPNFLSQLLPMLLKECDIRDARSHEQEFADFYFPGNSFEDLSSLLPGLMTMLGDVHYKTSILSTAKLLSDYVPTRVFRYEFEGGPHLFDVRYPDKTNAPAMPEAVGHGDEMILILPEGEFEYTPDQKAMSKKLLDLIENFAYNRIDQATWPKFNTNALDTLVFGAGGSTSIHPFDSPERLQMLEKLHDFHHDKIIQSMKEEAEAAESKEKGETTEGSHDEL